MRKVIPEERGHDSTQTNVVPSFKSSAPRSSLQSPAACDIKQCKFKTKENSDEQDDTDANLDVEMEGY